MHFFFYVKFYFHGFLFIPNVPISPRPHPHLNKPHPKPTVNFPGTPKLPANPRRAYLPAWRPQFKCNKELFSASESCAPAVLSAAAFPEAKSVCNAWSDTHWQPAQTFPAWLQRLQRQGEIPEHPQPPPLPCLTWHFLIKALNLEARMRTSSLGEAASALCRSSSAAYTCLSFAFEFLISSLSSVGAY